MERFRLKKNIKTTLLAFIVNLLLVFVSYRVLIMVGGVAAVGIWATTLAWASVVRFGDLGMANASVRFVARYDHEKEVEQIAKVIETGIVSNALLFASLNFIVYLVLLETLHFAFSVPEELADALKLLPFLLMGQFISNTANAFLGVLTGLHKGYLASYMRIVGNVAQLVLVLVLVPRMGITGLAIAQITQFCVTGLFAWIAILKTVKMPFILPYWIDKKTFREMLGFSISSQLSSIANGLFEPLSKILLSLTSSTEVQGLYELAYKSAFLPRNGVVAAVNASLPAMTYLYREDKPAFQTLYKTASKRSFIASALVMGCVALGAPMASYLWMGYIDTNYWLMVVGLCFAFFISAWAAPAYLLAQITGKFRANTMVSFAAAAALFIIGRSIAAIFNHPAAGIVGVIIVVLVGSNLIIKALNEQRFLK